MFFFFIVSRDAGNLTPVDAGNDNETLIQLVKERPALWNHSLQLGARTKLKKETLWTEILNNMGDGGN